MESETCVDSRNTCFMLSTLYYIMRYADFSCSEHLTRWFERVKADLSEAETNTLETFRLKGTSIYCHERFKCEANGAQKPECTEST